MWGFLKSVFCSAWGFCVAYFAPTWHVLTILSILVVADWVTGIFASRKANIDITSRRLTHSVVKWLCYITAILLTFMAEQALTLEFNFYLFTAGYIYGCEILSIFENLAVISDSDVYLRILAVIRGRSKDMAGVKDALNEEMRRK